MALETGCVTSSQDPAVPLGPSMRRGRRGLFCFVFCFLKALKRRVIYCSVIKAFLHLFDFGSQCAISFSWKMPSKGVGG